MPTPIIISKIEAIFLPSLEALGYAHVLTRVMESRAGRTLQIMAERVDGQPMTLEDCTLISRTVSALLDVDDPIQGAYNLEISSPGIDRPLVKPADFERYAGHEAKIETALPVEMRRRFKGKILGLEDGNVRMALADGEALIEFANIQSAKLLLTDALVAEYLRQEPKEKKEKKATRRT